MYNGHNKWEDSPQEQNGKQDPPRMGKSRRKRRRRPSRRSFSTNSSLYTESDIYSLGYMREPAQVSCPGRLQIANLHDRLTILSQQNQDNVHPLWVQNLAHVNTGFSLSSFLKEVLLACTYLWLSKIIFKWRKSSFNRRFVFCSQKESPEFVVVLGKLLQDFSPGTARVVWTVLISLWEPRVSQAMLLAVDW